MKGIKSYHIFILQNKLQIRAAFVIFRGYASVCKKEFVAAFRECFARLGELRSLCPQNPVTPVLALTATASKDSQATVMESLCMRKNCLIIIKKARIDQTYILQSSRYQWMSENHSNF